MRIALIKAGTVLNVVEATGGWRPPAGVTSRELSPEAPCGPGWTVDGADFMPPADRPPASDVEELSATVVALALLVLEELNRHSQEWTGFKGAVAAAASLNDLKTRVAALPNMPDRTRRQLLDAVRAKLNDGSS